MNTASAESWSFVRIFHASPDAGVVDVFLDGTKILSNFQYGTLTGYTPVVAGAHTVQIAVIGTGVNAAILTQDLFIADRSGLHRCGSWFANDGSLCDGYSGWQDFIPFSPVVILDNHQYFCHQPAQKPYGQWCPPVCPGADHRNAGHAGYRERSRGISRSCSYCIDVFRGVASGMALARTVPGSSRNPAHFQPHERKSISRVSERGKQITMLQLRCSALLLLAVALSGCGLLSTHPPPAATAHSTHHRPASRATPRVQARTGRSASIPARLLIPAIGVNAAERVEILANGNLATPTRHPWDDAGWYDLGTPPGARGSAVIDGHLDRPGGSPAVFWNLRKLHRGDSVLVIDTQGILLRFRVLAVSFYPPQAAPVQAIFGNHASNDLNLITCAGDWVASQHQTTLRLVVYTMLIS